MGVESGTSRPPRARTLTPLTSATLRAVARM
jgi:hypothetical protein